MNEKRRLQISKLAASCKDSFKRHRNYWIDDEWGVFDYPFYGGLPKRVLNRLSSDCVDVIQEYANDLAASGHQRFSKVRLEKLLVSYYKQGYEIP